MELDLILSDLASVLKESENVQRLERELDSVYRNLPARVIDQGDITLHGDAITLDNIKILDDEDDIEIRIMDDENLQDAVQQQEGPFLSIDIEDGKPEDHITITLEQNYSPENFAVQIAEHRQSLENAISQLKDLINQDRRVNADVAQDRQNADSQKQVKNREYDDAVNKEQMEEQRTQAQLNSSLNQLQIRLRQKQNDLRNWWILPQILPFFFKENLDLIQRLSQQISDTGSQIRDSRATLNSMLEWHQSSKNNEIQNINTQLANSEQNYQVKTRQIIRNIQNTRLQCDHEILSKYKMLLNDWTASITKILRDWHPSLANAQLPESQGELQNRGLRVGSLILRAFLDETPAVLDPFGNHKHIFISGGATLQRNTILHNLVCRTLLAFPAGMARLLLIDRVELGGALKLFSNRLHKDLAGGVKVFDQDREIEEQISTLRAKVSQITQTILSEYPSIDAFNLANPDIPTPYRFIIISNFPNGFSQQTLTALNDIMRNGPRAGTYVIASVSDNLPQRDFDISNFTNGNYTLSLRADETLAWNSEYLAELNVALDGNLEASVPELLSEISKAYENKPTFIEYERVARRIPSAWIETTTRGLRAPVGLTFEGDLHEIKFNDDVVHGLIGGITGSGKTVLMHNIICGLAQYHSPEELDLYLLDFKGTEFDVYAKKGLPHARVVAVSCDSEVGFEIIRELNQEMGRRRDLFNREDVQDIQAYKEKGLVLPRILLIIDEVQHIIEQAPNSKIERELEANLKDLFKRGRSMGIHVLIGTQSPSGVLSSAMLQQLKVRICMMASPDVSNLVLGSTNDGATELQKKGEAVYNENFGIKDLNKLFRTANLQREKVVELVSELKTKADEILFTPSKPMYYFTGESSETILANKFLKDKIKQHAPETSRSIIVPVGNALGPKEDIAFQLSRARYGNAIILGGGGDDRNQTSGAEQLHHLFTNTLLALCIQLSVQRAQFFLIDLTSPDSPAADRLRIFQKMPHEFQFAYNSQVSIEILQSVHEILAERKENSRAGAQDEKSIFLAIFGAENFSELRSGDRFASSETRKKLEEILIDGPQVGIHAIVAAQTLAKGEILKADEFGVRIALQVSEDDSRRLFDSEIGMTLGEKRGIYKRNESKKTEKFKFYIPLSENEIRDLAKQLSERESGR